MPSPVDPAVFNRTLRLATVFLFSRAVNRLPDGAAQVTVVAVLFVAGLAGWLLGRRYPARPEFAGGAAEPLWELPVIAGFGLAWLLRSPVIIVAPCAVMAWVGGVATYWYGRTAGVHDRERELHEARRIRKWAGIFVGGLVLLALVIQDWAVMGVICTIGLPTIGMFTFVVHRAEKRVAEARAAEPGRTPAGPPETQRDAPLRGIQNAGQVSA